MERPGIEMSTLHGTRASLLAVALLAAGLLTLATSKRLSGKLLERPEIRVSSLAAVKGRPLMMFSENVNNQGCFSRQVLDFILNLELENLGCEPLMIKVEEVELLVDGKRRKVTAAFFRVLDQDMSHSAQKSELAAKSRGTLIIKAERILPKSALKSISTVELRVSSYGGWLTVRHKGIEKIPMTDSIRVWRLGRPLGTKGDAGAGKAPGPPTAPAKQKGNRK